MSESKRDIAADKAMCEAATPGKWTVLLRGCHELGYDIVGPRTGVRGMFARREDANFCAESHAALPHYIDRTKAAESRDAELEAMLDEALQILAFSRCALVQSAECPVVGDPSVEECKRCWGERIERTVEEAKKA